MSPQIAQPKHSPKFYLSHKSSKWPSPHYLTTSLILLTYLCSVLPQISASSTFPKLYDSLESSYFCFRRLNQTHQFGCTSQIGGNYGIAKLIQSSTQEEDLQYIASNGPNPPYVAIIDVIQFSNISLLQFLKNIEKNRISGLLVLDTGVRPNELTSDSSCPNEFSSLYAKDPTHAHCNSQQWNKPTPNHLEGMMFMDFPFPMFLLRNKPQIDSLKKKMQDRPLSSWPKLAIELLAPMHAAKDAITCMRRSSMSGRFNLYPDVLCDPLGGLNIFHHSLNLSSIQTIERNSIVVLAARQDSFSMFDAMVPGADSALTSVIVLLAVAEMLNQGPIKKDIVNARNSTLFALFDGEAFDYIGSSDTAYRMQENNFIGLDPFRKIDQTKYPTINLTHLSHFIELSQLGKYNNEDKYQLYLHKNLQAPPQLQTLLKLLRDEAESHNLKNLILTNVSDNRPLPPSSAQSFLKKRKDDNFSVVVASNHEKEYINKFYNSFYEDGSDFSTKLAQQLTDVATLFGLVTYRLVTGKSMTPGYTANESTIKELLTCFTNNSNCKLFQQVQDSEVTPNTNTTRPPLSTYVSVYGHTKIIREYTRLLLFRFTGDKIESVNTSSECKQLKNDNMDNQFTYIWQNGPDMTGECIRSSAYMVNTASPAYDLSSGEVDRSLVDEYSFWVESKWQQSSLRMFVVPSPGQKWATAILGLVILVLSFVVVICIERHAVTFFGDHSRPKQNGTSSSSSLRNRREDLPDSEESVSPNQAL